VSKVYPYTPNSHIKKNSHIKNTFKQFNIITLEPFFTYKSEFYDLSYDIKRKLNVFKWFGSVSTELLVRGRHQGCSLVIILRSERQNCTVMLECISIQISISLHISHQQIFQQYSSV